MQYYEKTLPNICLFKQTIILLKYALLQPDQSSKALSQKILAIISKYFQNNKKHLLDDKFIADNKENFEDLMELVFQTMGHKSQIKHNQLIMINIVKIFGSSDNDEVKEVIKLKSSIVRIFFSEKTKRCLQICSKTKTVQCLP